MTQTSINDVEAILKLAVKIGKSMLDENKAPAYSDSSVSEAFLVSTLQQAASTLGYDQDVVCHHGGHAFPDVTIKNSCVGIELKGTTSHRKFNGNSVVASTMKKGLKKIFLFYWIGVDREIGYRDYFESVPNPVVTHSPRFFLDIDLSQSDSMFGSSPGKVGTVDDVIFNGSIDSERIIKWMAERAKRNRETPWWIAKDEDIPSGSTGLVKFTDLPDQRRKTFMKSAFLAFPKILDKTSSTKYDGLFEWAITTKSVLTGRDNFSAGGQVEIRLPEFCNNGILVPKSIQTAIDSLAADNKVYLEEIENAQSMSFTTVGEFLIYYERQVRLNVSHIYETVKQSDVNSLGKQKFCELLASAIVSKIDQTTLVL